MCQSEIMLRQADPLIQYSQQAQPSFLGNLGMAIGGAVGSTKSYMLTDLKRGRR